MFYSLFLASHILTLQSIYGLVFALSLRSFEMTPLQEYLSPQRRTLPRTCPPFCERHPLLTDCWGTMDGLKLFLQASGNSDIQERYYNGWTYDHYVTSVFCFCPNGTTPIAFFNIPGCVHDSQVAEMSQIYWKLGEVYEKIGAKCCVDSAFGNVDREYLYKSCQDLLRSSAPTQAERKMELQKRREATSARQTAEWGMLKMQVSFPRVRDQFVYKEHGERRIVLKMFVLLYYMRARMVGINQIRNTYMQHLLHNANEDVCF
jgi:hypothetical protein